MEQISEPALNNPFPHLKRAEGLSGLGNLGGKFALPAEFDAEKYASALVTEGNEVLAMQADQPVVGTPYSSEGWQVWKFPDNHPLAGKKHVVRGSKEGENFVLMFRPIEVQEQVNQAYGELSISQMTAEVKGETLSVAGANQDPGMLTEERLRQEIGAEIDRDEALGRSTASHGMRSPRKLTKEPKKLTKTRS